MTLAPPYELTATGPKPSASPFVTAVLVLHDGATWLAESLNGLAAQSRPPDRLIVVDTGSIDTSLAIVAAHQGVREAVSDVVVLTLARETSFGEAVARAAREVDRQAGGEGPPQPSEWLWLLHDDGAAAPLTLARLLDAVRRSPSVGIAGPKVVQWDAPGRLVEVGQQVTRSGRRAGGPVPGELDQGQYDGRTDVLGVGSSGMLVRRDVFAAVRGFDPRFARFGGDLDLCWRAQLAGHRVLVVPTATVREAAATAAGERDGGPSASLSRRLDRRQTRLVALARCPVLLVPLLAAWIAVSAVGSALVLLLLKRPRRAWFELGDLGALAHPWRALGSRWRARGTRQVRRRDLVGLFVPRAAALRSTIDQMHDAVTFEGRAGGPARSRRSAPDTESGPVAEEAEDLQVTPATWPQRVARHPGFLAVLLTALVAAAAWRTLLLKGAFSPGGTGLSGGELLPVRADGGQLWHTWLDAWQGAGLGSALESPPHVAALAGLAYLVGHLPFLPTGSSPVGVALAWLLLAAGPLSAWTAYLASRLTTTRRWPRAWAALAWGTLSTLSTAAAAGRIGAVVGHITLPLVMAGIAYAARSRSTAPVTFGTALAVATLCAFDPPLGVLALVAAVAVLLLGRRTARLRALILLLVPAALVGPWLLQYVHEPALLLTGPGLQAWGVPTAPAWQTALLHPPGAPTLTLYLAAPIVLAGLAGLLRRAPSSRLRVALAALGALALIGLAAALAAPHVSLAAVPAGLPGPGRLVTPWSGTGIDVAAAALIAAALVGSAGLVARVKGSRWHWRGFLVAPVLALAVAGVLATAGAAAWKPASALTAAPDLPAVAGDQVGTPSAARVLLVSSSADGSVVDYALQGMEPGPLARVTPVTPPPADPRLAAAARALLSPAGTRVPGTGASGAGATGAATRLADLAVGFVGVRDASPTVSTALDSTAGLVRLGTTGGLTMWRVLPRDGSGAGASVASSRARLETSSGSLLQSVPVTGAHAATRTRLAAGPAGRRLVVAEPSGWAHAATVRFGGRVLHAIPGATQPTYAVPVSAGALDVHVASAHPVWVRWQLGLLALTVFLALPFGNRRSRRPW